MATTTTNLELILPEGTENISRSVLNTNFFIIDEAFGDLPNDPVFSGSISANRKANTTVGSKSVAAGNNVEATGLGSHAEGSNTKASWEGSHAEGQYTVAETGASHAEGLGTNASGTATHAGGKYNVANSTTFPAWVSGTHYIPGNFVEYSNNGYYCTTENTDTTFDSSKWIAASIGNYKLFAEIIGNGINSSTKSNARALDWNGNEYLMGDLYVGCNPDSTGGSKVLTESNLDTATTTETQAIITEYVRS